MIAVVVLDQNGVESKNLVLVRRREECFPDWPVKRAHFGVLGTQFADDSRFNRIEASTQNIASDHQICQTLRKLLRYVSCSKIIQLEMSLTVKF